MKLCPQTYPFILPLPQYLHLIAYWVCVHMFSVNFDHSLKTLHAYNAHGYVCIQYLHDIVHVCACTYYKIITGCPSMAVTCNNIMDNSECPDHIISIYFNIPIIFNSRHPTIPYNGHLFGMK